MDNKKTENSPGVGCGLALGLFALPFAGVGVFMLYMFASTLFSFLYMQTWEKTDARLLNVEKVTNRSSKSTTHSVKAQYEYSVDGKKYNGSKVSLYPKSDNVGSYQLDQYKLLNKNYKKKKNITCRYNPGNPASSILFVDLRWEILAFYLIFIFAFGGFGFGMAFVAFKSFTGKIRVNAVGGNIQNTPWRQNNDWMKGEISYSNKTSMTILTLAAVIWNLISFPLWIVIIYEIFSKGNKFALIGLFFPVAGFIILILAARSIARWRKFGESIFRMKSVPGVIGGKLEGAIDTSCNIAPEDGFELSLSCVNRITTGSGKSRSVREEILWDEKKVIKRELLYKDYTRSSIPVLFGIPWEGVRESSMDKSSNDMVLWRLKVNAAVPGIDYKASFEIPVFKTEESSPDFKLEDTQENASAHKPNLRESLSGSGIRMEKISKHVQEFIFPAFRNVGLSLFAIIFALVWTGITVALIFLTKRVPVLFPIVFGIADFFIIIWALRLLFYRSKVIIDSSSLTLCAGTFLTKKREFDLEEIDKVILKGRTQLGQKTFHDLAILLYSGKSVKIAARIPSRKTAEELAEEINKAIRG